MPVFAPVDPLGTAGAATACTKLTEDDNVFAVLGFFQAADVACYLTTHDVPIIGASLTAAQSAQAKAPWFNNIISDSDLIPKEMAIFKQEGAFAGKKVGVVGTSADQAEMNLVLPELHKLGVNVVQTAVNSVPDTDTTASDAGVRRHRAEIPDFRGERSRGGGQLGQRLGRRRSRATRAPTTHGSSPPTTSTSMRTSPNKAGVFPGDHQERADGRWLSASRRRVG